MRNGVDVEAQPRTPVDVAVGVLVERDADGREGRFLLTSRPEGKVYAGHWEFPGGKLEAGETVEQALQASERELQEYTLMLQRAAEAAQLIMAHPSLEATLQEVADQARRVIGARRGLVTLTDNRHDALPARSFSGDVDAAIPMGALLTVPLVSRSGRHIGRLQVSGKEAGSFTQRDEYVLLELAQLASIAVENARLFTEIRELNAGLEARIAERRTTIAQAVAAVTPSPAVTVTSVSGSKRVP